MRITLLLLLLSVFYSSALNAQISIRTSATKALKDRSSTALEVYREGLKYLKNGPTDYEKAFLSFKTAANMGDDQACFATAYCLFKGIGCNQQYEQAVRLFREGALKGRDNSMYFLGLAFKNNYGIQRDEDSAKYWLGRAAALGYKQAIEELKTTEAENANNIAAILMEKINRAKSPKLATLNEFKRVEGGIPSKSLIAGTYQGYTLHYDWSGKYLISSTPLKLVLQDFPAGATDSISGTWTDKTASPIQLSGLLTGDSVLFEHTSYKVIDHYSWGKPINYEFKSAILSLTQSGDSVYLSGMLSLFSPDRNEPSKPILIALVRNTAIAKSLRDSLDHQESDGTSSLSKVISSVRVYPNPFSTVFTSEFVLKEDATVQLVLYNMVGDRVFKKDKTPLKAGKYAILISPGRLTSGMYILKLLLEDGRSVDLKVIRR